MSRGEVQHAGIGRAPLADRLYSPGGVQALTAWTSKYLLFAGRRNETLAVSERDPARFRDRPDTRAAILI